MLSDLFWQDGDFEVKLVTATLKLTEPGLFCPAGIVRIAKFRSLKCSR